MVGFTWLVRAAVATWALHPLHTTLTEMTADASHHSVRAVVRVFADDVGLALAKHGPKAGTVRAVNASDDQATAYVLSGLSAVDRAAHPVTLQSCGVKRSGDLLWVCVEGTVPGDARGLSLRNTVLCEVFSDQVNIVQVSGGGAAGGTERSILFTKGDGAKVVW